MRNFNVTCGNYASGSFEMRSLFVFIALLAVGGVALYALATNYEIVGSFLVGLGVHPDGFWTRNILNLSGIVLVGIPVGGLLWSIAVLGSDGAGTDLHGYTVLRLRTGVRYFFSFAAFALSALFVFAALDKFDEIIFPLVMIGFGCAFFFGGIWILNASIRYDNTAIFTTEYSGISRRHEWVDIEGIDYKKESQEYQLRFRTGRKARVSSFYQGLDDLIVLAESKLKAHARTS